MLSAPVRRVLDGETPWGSLTVQPDRFGTRYLLVIYPPGSTVTERRRVRIWRGWPVWGVLLWILLEMMLSQFLDPWFALALSIGLVTACVTVAYDAAAATRGQVHTLAATLLPRRYDPLSTELCEAMQDMAKLLREADSRRRTGSITPAEFEMTWWQVYDATASMRAAPA